MRVALRYLLRALVGFLALFALIVAGLTIYIRTASFNQLLEREVNKALEGSLRGQITIGAIQTPRLGLLNFHDVAIVYQGRTLLRLPLAEISYALIPLLWHQVDLKV